MHRPSPDGVSPEGDFVCIEPVGACALLVMRLMEAAGMELTKEQRKLVVLAMYLDTIALRSSKISIDERRWAREEAARLGMDEAWLIREGMDLADMTLPPETLAMMGLKRYDFAGLSVCSTYVQTDAMTPAVLDAIWAFCVLKSCEKACSAGSFWCIIHVWNIPIDTIFSPAAVFGRRIMIFSLRAAR
ncbi:MAG: hypothetical protein ACLR4A_16185 [Christensenellales bacterium]